MDSGENSGVSGDDFFGVVRRRHPDIDVILLPQEPPAEQPEQRVAPGDLVDVPARFDAELTALWAQVARGIAPPEVASRWTPGSLTGSVAREALLATDGVDGVTATQALTTAERALTADGWHVLAPRTGMPRVLAGRDGTAADPVRREVQVVYVAARGRYAVTYRCGSYVVGHHASRELVEDGSEGGA
jgi:hypothetical protein